MAQDHFLNAIECEGREHVTEIFKIHANKLIPSIIHFFFQFKYFFLASTASLPFHRTSSDSFLEMSASSSSVHSWRLSPAYARSRCSRFPETRSSFLRSAGRVVWYSLARTLRTEASSDAEMSFWGSSTRFLLSDAIQMIFYGAQRYPNITTKLKIK